MPVGEFGTGARPEKNHAAKIRRDSWLVKIYAAFTCGGTGCASADINVRLQTAKTLVSSLAALAFPSLSTLAACGPKSTNRSHSMHVYPRAHSDASLDVPPRLLL